MRPGDRRENERVETSRDTKETHPSVRRKKIKNLKPNRKRKKRIESAFSIKSPALSNSL